MATNFPTTLDNSTTIPAESASTVLATNHVTAHQNIQDAIEAIEAKVGVNSSAVTTTHDYKLSEILTTDKSVGKSATQTLANKTLTSPVINVGSDATGDLYYRNAGGLFTRLAIGSANHILNVTGGIPAWRAEATISNATSSATGISELATSAEITAGTATGGSGGPLVVTPDQLLAAGIKQSNIQTFTADGTWTKPAGARFVLVKAYGGGGGGGGGDTNAGAGGGGGGAYKEISYDATDLSATEAIVVGAAATGGASTANGSNGVNSTFGTTKVIAYGGAGGLGNTGSSSGAGGGGGGNAGAGGLGSTTTGGGGGALLGGTGSASAAGGTSVFGGGAGGGSANSGTVGGLSIYGGGGGGGAASNNGAPGTGGAGALSFYAGGGGGAGGGSAGGAAGTSTYGGAGGAGSSSGAGSAGVVPSGGGGGSGSANSGGAGARGQITVITYF